ncbi:hypothetical protein GEV33_002925 [Tenebrio molitor]|uniref:PDZ domain-containing protein n=1 Tax=Tenebrio molitor TaxID=7067 RepID=A0A8J6HTX7_TENMO|nr:hypothetical protein GEV33_002925 [Tenebrio molitor]
MQNGIIKGDEIMVINGAIVSDLDMMYLESVLQEELALCMMMRSSRTEPPDLAGILRATDDIIDSLVCPPPPSEPPVISEEMISGLIVPAPGWSDFNYVAPVFADEIKVPLYWDEDDPVPRSCHKEPNGKQKKDYPVPGTVKQHELNPALKHPSTALDLSFPLISCFDCKAPPDPSGNFADVSGEDTR